MNAEGHELDGCFHVTPVRQGDQEWLTVLCKQHWRFDPKSGALGLATRSWAPLHHDVEYANRPDRPGRSLVQGRDLWPHKARTDLVIQGSMQCPEGRPYTQRSMRVRFQGQQASALVLGDRYAYRRHGQLRFSSPQPFVQMPLDEFHAYGGIDPTLVPQGITDTPMLMGLPVPEFFPGAYPRNPAGMGYWIHEQNFVEGLRLPNLEDPKELLTLDNFFRGHPERWPLAPDPVCWGFRSTLSYPRCLHAGRKPYAMPRAGDSLAWARLDPVLDRPLLDTGPMELQLSPEFMQQGCRALSVPIQDGSLELSMQGICSDEPLALEVPDRPPSLRFVYEGQERSSTRRRLTVRVHPNHGDLFVTWAISMLLDPRDHRDANEGDAHAWLESLQRRCWIGLHDQSLPAESWLCAPA